MNRPLAAIAALLVATGVAVAANWPSTTGTTTIGVVLENGSNGTRLVSTSANQLAVNTEGTKATYSFAFGPQTSFAVAATDWVVVGGSATKAIRIDKMSVCGTATAATTIDVALVKRSTADTAGTISSTPNAVAHDPNNAAGSATVNSYSANPTLGTLVGSIDVKKWNLGTPAGGAGCVYWQWSDTNGQMIVLRGVAQQLAVNLLGVAPPAGASLDAKVEVTEE